MSLDAARVSVKSTLGFNIAAIESARSNTVYLGCEIVAALRFLRSASETSEMFWINCSSVDGRATADINRNGLRQSADDPRSYESNY
jgi:hypothetical protein